MVFRKVLSYLLLAGAAIVPAAAAPVSVRLSMDSVNLQMGRMSAIHVALSQPKDVKGHFPLLQQIGQNGIIPVCGDSVEFRAPVNIDTIDAGNALNIKMDIPVQAFDSGYYQLPPLVFVSGRDSVASNSLALKVYPVNATADTPIGDFASVADPADSSIFDFIPDWVLDFWWVFVILLLAIAAFVYGMKRYRKEGSLLPKKPEPTPYEEAISGLRALKTQQLWEQGQEKEYYTQLTDILRRYLYRRFGINATEMTSRQILARLGENKELTDKRSYFRQILDMADFVKFAKVRPLPDDNVLAFDNALRFVEETKPAPVVENPEKDEKGGEK